MWMLWILCFWFQDTLVLQGGKKIQVDRYERKGGQVRVYRGSQVFSLPDKQIDWAATQKLQQAMANAPSASSSPPNPEPKLQPTKKKPPSKPIVFTQEDLPEKSEISKPVTIPYRKLGNNIVVPVVLNGSGPFEMVLDTGASVTVVSPSVAQKLNVAMSPSTHTIMGVGGQPVKAQQGTLKSLSIGGAKVPDLRFMSHDITFLTSQGVIGLLGQDFLNHFVMNLDSAKHMLTLKPHTTASSTPPREAQTVADYVQARNSYSRLLAGLRSTFNRMQGHYRDFAGNRPETREARNGMDQLVNQYNDLRMEINTFYTTLRRIPLESFQPDDRRNMRALLSCQGSMEAYIRQAQQFSRNLKRAFSIEPESPQRQRARRDLEIEVAKLNELSNELNQCSPA